MAHYKDADEIKIVSSILNKAGINNICDVDYKIDDRESDIDILGMTDGNIVILIECAGAAKFGSKLDVTIPKFTTVIQKFNVITSIIRRDYRRFYNQNRDIFESSSKIFKKLIVTLNKETSTDIDILHRRRLTNNDIYVWTEEQRYYYKRIAECTYHHCKYEIFSFFNLKPTQVATLEQQHILAYLAFGRKINDDTYILNMVVPAVDLLKRTSIKRLRDTSTEEGYQRLLSKTKLKGMREYLLKTSTSYPNNIICVLNKDASINKIKKIATIETLESKSEFRNIVDTGYKNLFYVTLPDDFDTFEVIDGQHRLYSYAQTEYHVFTRTRDKKKKQLLKRYDNRLAKIAKEAYMVVTAICSKSNFFGIPAKLFYEINTKQTKIGPEDIIDLMERFYKHTPTAKANKLLKRLNANGILENKIRIKFWQKGRIKRTSLIEYSGLKDMFDPKKKLYEIFNKTFEQQTKLTHYDDLCFVLINAFLTEIVDLLNMKYVQKGKAQNMIADCSAKQYYLFSAVFVGALVRLLGHFISHEEDEFKIFEQLDAKLKDTVHLSIANIELKELFMTGLKVVLDNYTFTVREFKNMKNWGFNKWRQIEVDLIKTIRKKYPNFGDKNLI